MNIDGQWLIREPEGSRYLNNTEYLEYLFTKSETFSKLKEKEDKMKIQFLIWDFQEYKEFIAKNSPFHFKIDNEISFLKRIKKLKPIKGFTKKRSHEDLLPD